MEMDEDRMRTKNRTAALLGILSCSLTAISFSGCAKSNTGVGVTGVVVKNTADLPNITDPVGRRATGSVRTASHAGARIATTGRTVARDGVPSGLDLSCMRSSYTSFEGEFSKSYSLALFSVGWDMFYALSEMNGMTMEATKMQMLVDAKKVSAGTNTTFGYTHLTGPAAGGALSPIDLKTKIRVTRDRSNNITDFKMYSCDSSRSAPTTKTYLSSDVTYEPKGRAAPHLELVVARSFPGYQSRAVARGDLSELSDGFVWSGVKSMSSVYGKKTNDSGKKTNDSGSKATSNIVGNTIVVTASDLTYRRSDVGSFSTFLSYDGHSEAFRGSFGRRAALKADIISNPSSPFGFNLGSGCLRSTSESTSERTAAQGGRIVFRDLQPYSISGGEDECFDINMVVSDTTNNHRGAAEAAYAFELDHPVTASDAAAEAGEDWDCTLPEGEHWTRSTLDSEGADAQLWSNIMNRMSILDLKNRMCTPSGS